jgi:hypothetical protein
MDLDSKDQNILKQSIIKIREMFTTQRISNNQEEKLFKLKMLPLVEEALKMNMLDMLVGFLKSDFDLQVFFFFFVYLFILV